jgi:hypothetical protein
VRVPLPFHRGGEGSNVLRDQGLLFFPFSHINRGKAIATIVRVIRVGIESRQHVWMLCSMRQRTVSSCLPRLAK